LSLLAAPVFVPTKEIHVLLLTQKYATSYNVDGKAMVINFPIGVIGVNE
jgi:hypothetical protein